MLASAALTSPALFSSALEWTWRDFFSALAVIYASSTGARVSETQREVTAAVARHLPTLKPNVLFCKGPAQVTTTLKALAYRVEPLLNPKSKRNRRGGVFTPPPLAALVVRHLLEATRSSAEGVPSILDPACGSGIFLLELIDQLYQHSSKAASRAPHTLFAIDLDPRALAVARLLVAVRMAALCGHSLSQALRNLANNFVVGNSLLDSSEIKANASWQPSTVEFGNGRLPAEFDLIVGNPPYGLSRDQQLSARENELLKRKFAHYRSGKANKYMLFLARCYELLSARGSLSFVVPNAWLGIDGGARLRERLMADRAVHSIITFEERVFPNASVEPVVVTLQRGGASSKFHIIHRRAVDESPHQVITLDYTRWTAPLSRISLRANTQANLTLDKIALGSTPLGSAQSPFEPKIALQAYAVGKGTPPQTKADAERRRFHSRNSSGRSWIKYLEGSDIKPFCTEWSGEYLHYGSWLAEPQIVERFQGPRVLIREILGPLPYHIHAAFLSEAALYNKSVLHILLKDKTRAELAEALVALLNSRLASFWISHRGRKSQRSLFPKLVNHDLKDFPLPPNFARHANQLAALARTAQRCAQSEKQVTKVRSKIDDVVNRSFNLTDKEAELVRCSTLPKPTNPTTSLVTASA